MYEKYETISYESCINGCSVEPIKVVQNLIDVGIGVCNFYAVYIESPLVAHDKNYKSII